MSDADIKANIGVSTDVEQATKKTSAAITSMSKQVEDIQKKFTMAGKDIFLGFFAPMAILQKLVEQFQAIKQASKDALDFGADASNKYVNEQESNIRRLIKLRDEDVKNRGMADRGTREAYADILLNTPEGKKIFRENRQFGQGFRDYKEGDITKGFDKIAAEEMIKNPRIRAQVDEIVNKMLPNLEEKKANAYKGPEGISSVIGVGNNAVMQAMLDSLNEQRMQTQLLQQIAASGGNLPNDFTKSTNAAPSRSYLLKK